VFDDLYALFWWLADYIADLFYSLMQWLTQQFNSILTWFRDTWNMVLKSISDILKFVGDVFDFLAGELSAFLQNLIAGISDAFAQAWAIVKDAVVNVLNAISNFAANLFANIKAQISSILTSLQVVFQQWIDRVESFIAGVLDAIVDAYNYTVEVITNGIQTVFNFVKDMLVKAGDVVNQALTELVSGPAAVFEQLSTRFNDIASAFREKLTEVITSLTGLKEDIVQGLIEASDKTISALADWTNAPELTQLQVTLSALQSGNGEPVQYQDFIANLFQRFTPTSSLARGVVFILLAAVAAIPASLNAATIYAQPMIQALSRDFPYALLGPADVVTAWRKGLISREEAIDVIQRQGFSSADAVRYIGLSDAVPPEDLLLALWQRKIIGDSQLTEGMKERGFSNVWQQAYMEASFILPPIQDLIVMAVREVFSPAVAERFGQFDDFPVEFAEEAAKQGLTELWAKRYWAAHWGLPSATQGFEMLQRGVIEMEDLHLLLRSLDVMPFWRDKLVKIAYLPYTRVDIRRMHQLGVLTDDEVHRAHLDLGYEEEKAQHLTEFVLRLNKNAPGEDDAELGRLSRSSILAFYRDGLLPRARAAQLLVSLGLTDEASSIYLDSVDVDEERAERKAETDIIIAQAEAGAITFAEAQDRLNGLGLETLEVEKALTKLARSEKARVKLPSREDGERFLKLGLINGIGYRDLLLRLGYSPQWADVYVNAAFLEGKSDAKQS
jgi:hypothetical protein